MKEMKMKEMKEEKNLSKMTSKPTRSAGFSEPTRSASGAPPPPRPAAAAIAGKRANLLGRSSLGRKKGKGREKEGIDERRNE